MKKNITGTLLIAVLLTGCGTEQATPEAVKEQTDIPIEERILADDTPALVSFDELLIETHEITEINDGWLRGENVTGQGEGVYYQTEYLESKLGEKLQVGDLLEFYWTTEQADNSDWEEVYAVKKVQ